MKNLNQAEKADLIGKLKSLSGLTDDERASLIELLNQRKKYGLVWEDKPEQAELAMKTKLPILREVKERAIVNDAEAPNHILIEGDNLHALTALSYTHAGKIDVIYIDPPYNTGNKDFVYNDSFIGIEDEYRHSKWLSFINKRLRIAKRLLSDRGVIFISIDDNEQSNLKLLCDEMFGERNFTGQLIIKTATDNNPSQINTEHEYMLCYCSNKNLQDNWKRTSQAAKDIIEKYNELRDQELNISQIQKELRKWIKANKDNLSQVAHYNNVDEKGVYSSSGNSSNPHPGGYMYDIIHPITRKPCPKPQNGWRWPLSTFEKYDFQGEIEWGIDETTQPHVKKRIETSTEYLRTLIYEDNRGTTLALTEMFGGTKVFDNPKPIKVISKVIDFASSKNSTILDFFAGSGTTLHATMQLNAEDGGHRQCILATNNENNICEDVTYERNKRVIYGYTTPRGEKVEGLKANNLRYYKVKAVPRDTTIKSRMQLAAGSVDLLCIMENLYQEKDGFGEMGYCKGLRYFEEKGRGMLIVLDTDLIPNVVEQIKKMQPATPLQIYVYAPSDYAFDEEFEEVADKVELHPLPQPMLNAYKQWLPKQDEVMIDIPDNYQMTEEQLNETGEDFKSNEE